MEFCRLYSWGEFKYVASMHDLMLFDATGMRVAAWFVDDKGEYGQWYFHCLVNTLNYDLSYEFRSTVVKEWQQIVDARLRECYVR